MDFVRVESHSLNGLQLIVTRITAANIKFETHYWNVDTII